MSQIGVTLFLFGLCFTEDVWKELEGVREYEYQRIRYLGGCGIDQSVTGNEFYWKNACIEHRKFCDYEKCPVEYLRGEFLARISSIAPLRMAFLAAASFRIITIPGLAVTRGKSRTYSRYVGY